MAVRPPERRELSEGSTLPEIPGLPAGEDVKTQDRHRRAGQYERRAQRHRARFMRDLQRESAPQAVKQRREPMGPHTGCALAFLLGARPNRTRGRSES